MIFYEICARRQVTPSEITDVEKKNYREITENLLQKCEKTAFIAISHINSVSAILVMAVEPESMHQYSPTTLLEEWNQESGLSLSVKLVHEIPLNQFKRRLRMAERSEYIEDRDRLLSDLNLECDCRYKEILAKDFSREEMSNKMAELLYDKSVLPEIDRIYQVKNKSEKLYHPVHYVIRSDDETECSDVLNCMISALYENRRVFSKRYSMLNIHSYLEYDRFDWRRLYSIQRGGTVVLKLEPDGGSVGPFNASNLCEQLEWMCEIVNLFCNDVLTIFVLPQHCQKEMDTIYRYIGPLLIEIVPENAKGETAKKYLQYKAKKEDVLTTDSLFADLDPDKSYTSAELSEHFSRWHSNYIRNEMYPQYALLKKPVSQKEENRFGKALQELNDMIGLSHAKKMIYNALDYYKVQSMYRKLGKKIEQPSMHMVFTGNPGTAKTTVARLFAQILRDNDIITNGRLVEVGRADLVGKYVGHTAPLVKKAFERAEGGVLFIDEAYALLDDKEGMYGDEAINTIVQEMENRRNDTIVIFAGYPKEMEAFLARNPGLKSRIAFHVPFEDYSPQELVEIAQLMAKNKENTISEDALPKLSQIFGLAAATDDFGNGRYARNVMEKAELNRASRLAKLSFDEITEEMLATFVSQDFETDATSSCREQRIGF